MKFEGIIIFCLFACVSSCVAAGIIPFGKYELASVSQDEPLAVRRQKRTLTTICVEIKPSTPYEEPYFMCKGTDMPHFPKNLPSGGSSSSSYVQKPPSKTKPPAQYGSDVSHHSGVNSDYHVPVKSDYHQEHTKYGSETSYSAPSKPNYGKKIPYSDHNIHSSYASEENSRPSPNSKPYAIHESQSDYSKAPVRKPVYSDSYEKPSSHHESSYPSKTQVYQHGGSSFEHKPHSAEYSKPVSYEENGPYSVKPSFNDGSYSKVLDSSYGGGPSSKPEYSKPSSYSDKSTLYGHSDSSPYSQSTPSYTEHSGMKPYTKLIHEDSDRGHSVNEYGKHIKIPSKPSYSSQSQNYRTMFENMWDVQPHDGRADDFGYRAPVEYYNSGNTRTMDYDQQAPLKLDLTTPDTLPLQPAYPHIVYDLGYAHPQEYPPSSYGPAAPSYSSPVLPYNPPVLPSYPPMTTVPTYGSVLSAPPHAPTPYSSAPLPHAPAYSSYGSATPPYAPVAAAPQTYGPPPSSYSYGPPAIPFQGYKAPCHQTYLYNLQPALISLPCFTPPPSYKEPAYGQPLGITASPPYLSQTHQHYPSNINPLQDHSKARSEIYSEPKKIVEDNSTVVQSQESVNKPEVQSEPSKQIDYQQKLEKPEEKSPEKNQVSVAEKSREEHNGSTAGDSTGGEEPSTKAAYNALIRMSQIAAQLKKDDSNKGGESGAAAK